MAAWLFVWLSTPVVAQKVAETADSADVLVLDHDFGVVGELVRLFLSDKQVYRAELSTQDVTLELRPRLNGTQIPRVYPISDAKSSSGSSVVEIYPDQDGEYEIRPISMQGSKISTRLRLYRDVGGSRRRLGAASDPGWELGVELAGTWHSGFVQTSVAPAIGSEPSGGADIEGCLTARSRSRVPRFGMCILGVSHQSQRGTPSLLWVYTEPRLGVPRRDRHGYSSWEMGALFRFGVGINSGVLSPRIYAPGVFLSRHIRRNPQGAGWTLQLSYSRAFYKGFSRATATGSPVTPKSHRLSFGVGWYR